MSEMVDECVVCGCQLLTDFVKWETGTSSLNYVMCTFCGLVLLSPRPSESELETYYLAEYRIEQQGTERPTDGKISFEKRRASHLLEIIKSQITAVRVHLDIGCAAGELLMMVQNSFNCKSYGIEPSIAYREYLNQEFDVSVFPDIEAFVKCVDCKEKVDFISMIHVLEHIPRPVDYLRRLRDSILNEGGYLLVEVPNLLMHTAFEPSHLFAFSESTLNFTFEKAGFEIIYSKLHGFPRDTPRPHYITVLARVNENPVLSKQSVQPKRLLLRRKINRSKLYLIFRYPGYVLRKGTDKLIKKLNNT